MSNHYVNPEYYLKRMRSKKEPSYISLSGVNINIDMNAPDFILDANGISEIRRVSVVDVKGVAPFSSDIYNIKSSVCHYSSQQEYLFYDTVEEIMLLCETVDVFFIPKETLDEICVNIVISRDVGDVTHLIDRAINLNKYRST